MMVYGDGVDRLLADSYCGVQHENNMAGNGAGGRGGVVPRSPSPCRSGSVVAFVVAVVVVVAAAAFSFSCFFFCGKKKTPLNV